MKKNIAEQDRLCRKRKAEAELKKPSQKKVADGNEVCDCQMIPIDTVIEPIKHQDSKHLSQHEAQAD